MRTDGGEADDVAIGADAGWNAYAELDEDAGRVSVRVGDVDRLIDLEVVDIAEPVGRIVDARGGRGLRLRRSDRRSGGGSSRDAGAGQKLAAARIHELIAVRCHAFLPVGVR